MFPLHSLRAECIKALGFDAFFPSFLGTNRIAFLIPPFYYAKEDYIHIAEFIMNRIQNLGYSSKTITWCEKKTYVLGDKTHILGPHIEFEVIPTNTPTSNKKPEPIFVDNWVILCISYDDVNPDSGAPKTFNTFLWEAAFPTEYNEVEMFMKAKAIDAIRNIIA